LTACPNKQEHGDRQHRHLGAQPGAAPVGDQHPKRRGKAKRRVIERKAQAAADQVQRALAPAIFEAQPDRADREQGKRRGDNPCLGPHRRGAGRQ
jgi:hypothetical protein